MSSSDPIFTTYDSVILSDNSQRCKFLIDLLLNCKNVSIYNEFDKWRKFRACFNFSSGISKWIKFVSILWGLDYLADDSSASSRLATSNSNSKSTTSFRGSIGKHPPEALNMFYYTSSFRESVRKYKYLDFNIQFGNFRT